MDKRQKFALLIRLIKLLNKDDHQCTEYLLHQATYIMKVKLDIDFGFEYILDQQGLYSDDLHNSILDMFIEGCIKYINNIIIVHNHYDGRLATSIEKEFRTFTDQYNSRIETLTSVIEKLGNELPKLVTAIYMESNKKDPKEISKLRINLYKNANESRKYLDEAAKLQIA